MMSDSTAARLHKSQMNVQDVSISRSLSTGIKLLLQLLNVQEVLYSLLQHVKSEVTSVIKINT